MSFKNFEHWTRELNEVSKSYPVLVEGKRDVLALKRLGVRNVLALSGKRFADIPDLLEGRYPGVVMLMDLDPKGENMNKKLGNLLRSQGFEVLEHFREFLRYKGIIHIEELLEVWHG